MPWFKPKPEPEWSPEPTPLYCTICGSKLLESFRYGYDAQTGEKIVLETYEDCPLEPMTDSFQQEPLRHDHFGRKPDQSWWYAYQSNPRLKVYAGTMSSGNW